MEKIKLPVNELLCGLAEECAELGQAALKLRRAYDQTNPTPINQETAYDDFCEEIADVLLYLSQIPYNIQFVNEIMKRKLERWQSRLNAKEEE